MSWPLERVMHLISRRNANGVSSLSPKLARRRSACPGTAEETASTPTGLHSRSDQPWMQPRWGWCARGCFPKVGGRAANLGLDDGTPLAFSAKVPDTLQEGIHDGAESFRAKIDTR